METIALGSIGLGLASLKGVRIDLPDEQAVLMQHAVCPARSGSKGHGAIIAPHSCWWHPDILALPPRASDSAADLSEGLSATADHLASGHAIAPQLLTSKSECLNKRLVTGCRFYKLPKQHTNTCAPHM